MEYYNSTSYWITFVIMYALLGLEGICKGGETGLGHNHSYLQRHRLVPDRGKVGMVGDFVSDSHRQHHHRNHRCGQRRQSLREIWCFRVFPSLPALLRWHVHHRLRKSTVPAEVRVSAGRSRAHTTGMKKAVSIQEAAFPFPRTPRRRDRRNSSGRSCFVFPRSPGSSVDASDGTDLVHIWNQDISTEQEYPQLRTCPAICRQVLAHRL